MSDGLSQAQKDEFKIAFDFFDKDKAGKLQPDVYAQLMRSLGEDVSESDARSLCGADGVSFDVLIADREKRWAAQRSGETLRTAFGVLDRYGQGTVEAEDLKYMVTNYGSAPLTAAEADELCKMAGGGTSINCAQLIETMLKKKA